MNDGLVDKGNEGMAKPAEKGVDKKTESKPSATSPTTSGSESAAGLGLIVAAVALDAASS